MSKKLLFIHTPLQRCGHNYLAKIISKIVDISYFEYLEYESIMINTFSSISFEINKKTVRTKETKNKELKYTIDMYRKGLLLNGKFEYFIIKNTRFLYKNQIDLFNEDKHFILMRNPYDLFISYEKSLYDFRKKTLKNRFKLLIKPLYTLYIAYVIKRKMLVFFNEMDKIETNFIFLKYEDLDELSIQKEIFSYLKKSNEELNTKITIENTNSSFAKKNKKWQSNSTINEIGDPKQRFQNSSLFYRFFLKLMFGKIAKKYEKL